MYQLSEKNGNICPCLHIMVNFGILMADICWRVLGTPANFNGFRVLASLLHRYRSTAVIQTARCLAVSGLVHYRPIYILRGLLPTEFCQLQSSLCVRISLAFSYIDSVTERHSSSGRQPKFAAWYKEWNYRTFAEGATYIRHSGHHVAHRPRSS